MKTTFFKLILAGMIIILLPLFGTAKNQWSENDPGQTFLLSSPQSQTPTFSLRFLHPGFKEGSLSSLSGIYEFSANIPVNKKWNIIARLPYSNLSTNREYWYWEEESKSGIGNLFVGFQYRLNKKMDSPTSFTAGVYLPTISEKNAWHIIALGSYTDFYSYEKYMYNTTSLYANFSHHSIEKNNSRKPCFMYGFEIGSTYMIPGNKWTDYLEDELFLHYGLTAGVRVPVVDFKVELAGKMLVTESDMDLSERSFHMMSFGAQLNFGNIRPGIYYAIHLKEEYREAISGVLGIKLDIILNPSK
jgi:hypothetical protein